MPALAPTPTSAPPRSPARRNSILDEYPRVSFRIERALWERLVRLANEEYRKPDVQANYLLSKLLRALPDAPSENDRGR